MNTRQTAEQISGGAFDRTFSCLYSEKASEQRGRYCAAIQEFEKHFGAQREIALFSAPGRTEIGGNHTDHQHGGFWLPVLYLDILAVAGKNSENIIRIQSEGYPMDTIQLKDLSVQEGEKNHASALIRGIAARFQQLGMEIGGFDAYTTSNVLKGSGLSSSAAFETLVGVMLNELYAGGKADPVQIAQIGQYAENVYFGKPCGLMDQTACSVGGFVAIDFENPDKPDVKKLSVDFAKYGHKLCIVDTGGNHADLTGDYASAPAEMKSVARVFGREVLREVKPELFYQNLSRVRAACSDRAILRAFHFFADHDRVPLEVAALESGDFEAFKKLIIESGHSSFMYLQNVYTCKNPDEQGLSLGLAISEHLLAGRGAWRVHGGGFAGTIQGFVPDAVLKNYKTAFENVCGEGSCHILSIRPVGGVCITPELCDAMGKVENNG
jgi:galactokinase